MPSVEASDDRSLRVAFLAEIGREVPFDWHAWLLTDPSTEVGTAPVATVPSVEDLPRLIRAKYLTRLNRWTALEGDVVTLSTTTEADFNRSAPWPTLLAEFGVVDVASLAFRDRYGCWGWLDLWRGPDGDPFGPAELSYLRGVIEPATVALRGAVARSFGDRPADLVDTGPLVLVLSPHLEVRAQTPDTEAYLATLVPPVGDHRAIPAAAYNVAAQVLAVEAGVDNHPPTARVHLGSGAWLTVRAARVDSRAPLAERDIAVTIEAASPAQRRDLFVRSHALTARETDVVEQVAQGLDTRAIAATLFVSEHTVQDHLKSIFAKTGARNRRTLLARLAGQ